MSFFNELKRRNVFRVGIAYVVVAWLVLQVADVVINNVGAPGWVFQIIMLVLGIGFPIVLIFAWAFEMTPEGIKKESDVDRSQSVTRQTGRKLDFTIFGIMALALAYFVWESRFQNEPVVPAKAGTSVSTTEISVSAETSDATIASDNSIAVLPFANRSRDEDDAFFSDGIHDDLLTQLAKIGDLKVISRTSVMKYKGTQKTIPEIAEELGVSTILEGGIQRAGKRIRINAQLIDVTTDEHLWAETFDREMTMENIFDIQTEITRQIVTAVKGELSDTEQQALGAAPTANLEAYEAYLHARAATNRADYSKEKYIAAQPWAEKAVTLDPEFAEAWAVLAEIHGQAVWQPWAEKAVTLDPEFAEAWAVLAEIHGQAVWIGFDRSPERYTAADEALAPVLITTIPQHLPPTRKPWNWRRVTPGFCCTPPSP
jgi:TolB-like protein